MRLVLKNGPQTLHLEDILRQNKSLLQRAVLQPVPKSRLQEEPNLQLVPPRATHRQLRRLQGRRRPATVLQRQVPQPVQDADILQGDPGLLADEPALAGGV